MVKKNEEPLKVRDFGFDITSDHLGHVNLKTLNIT